MQRSPTAAEVLELPKLRPAVERSRSERLFGGRNRGRRGSTDVGRGGSTDIRQDGRFSMDRRGSARLPEAFGNMGRAMRGFYTVRYHPSPSFAPQALMCTTVPMFKHWVQALSGL